MSEHIDGEALRTMLSQMGSDRQMQGRFVRDYVNLWTSRFQRLEAALARPDAEEAHVVLLSIRSSSNVVGALRVDATAALMQTALREGDLPGAARHLPRLHTAGDDALAALTARFPPPPSPLR